MGLSQEGAKRQIQTSGAWTLLWTSQLWNRDGKPGPEHHAAWRIRNLCQSPWVAKEHFQSQGTWAPCLHHLPPQGVTSSSSGDCQGLQIQNPAVPHAEWADKWDLAHTNKSTLTNFSEAVLANKKSGFSWLFPFPSLHYLPTFHPVVKSTRFSVTLRRLGFFYFPLHQISWRFGCPESLSRETERRKWTNRGWPLCPWQLMSLSCGHHQAVVTGSPVVQKLSHRTDALVALQHCLHLLSEITACFLQH